MGCDCCPEGPDIFPPLLLTVTFNDDLTITTPVACLNDPGGVIFASGTPYTFALASGSGMSCSWVHTFDPDSCNGSAFIQCDGGTWYLVVSIFYFTLQTVRWTLPDFTCCDTTQTISLGLVSADALYDNLPTSVTITSDGCPTGDCDTTLPDAPDTLYDTLSAPGTFLDGLVVTLTRVDSTTFSGTIATECTDCTSYIVTLTCDGADYSLTDAFDGDSCFFDSGFTGCTPNPGTLLSPSPFELVARTCWHDVDGGCLTDVQIDHLITE